MQNRSVSVTAGPSQWRRWLGCAAAAWIHDARGTTAIEYALIASGVGATVAATVWGIGSNLQTNFYDRLSNLF